MILLWRWNLLLLLSLLLVLLLLFGGAHGQSSSNNNNINVQLISDFWQRAYTTSDLSVLRQKEVAKLIERTIPVKISDPAYFPLCGNGILDTKADYIRLYGPGFESMKMRYPKRAFFGEGYFGESDPTLNDMYDIYMIADEACDDGNRQDSDGCSSDCMSFDMLTSSCEIAMDRSLLYEDVLPVPQTGDMIVCALDGIYLIKEEEDEDSGSSSTTATTTITTTNTATTTTTTSSSDNSNNNNINLRVIQPLTLIYAKNFPVKNMYYFAGDFFLYSSRQQIVWKLNQQQQQQQPNKKNENSTANNNTTTFSLSIQFNLSAVLLPADCRVEQSEDALIFRDLYTVLKLDLANGTVVAQCTFPVALDGHCTFLSMGVGYFGFMCSKITTTYFHVIPTPSGVECSLYSHENSVRGSNIWSDIFSSLDADTAAENIKFPGYDSKISPDLIDLSGKVHALVPALIQASTITGLLIECMVGSPRILNDRRAESFCRFFGDDLTAPSFMVQDQRNRTCGPGMCMFDRPVGYDAWGSSPYYYYLQASDANDNNNNNTWMAVLQMIVDKELNRTRSYALENPYSEWPDFTGTLGDLRWYNKSFNYINNIINEFSSIYRTTNSKKTPKRFFVSPKTNNVWMVRENSLHEISRSGVQVHVDNGLCLPSYMAMCPVCFWAESGTACRPCSVTVVRASAAWQMSCNLLCPSSLLSKKNSTTGSSSRRRLLLLLNQSSSGSVVFVVTPLVTGGGAGMTATASTTMLKTTWPNATITVWGGTEISVILKSNDIQATIASAVAKLNNNNELTKTIKVLIPPYGIDEGGSATTTTSSRSMSIVFVIDGATTTTTTTDHNNNNNNTSNTTTTTTITKPKLQLLPWPSGSTVSIVPGDRNTTVTISISNDPRDDMRSVKQVLSENLDLRLLVNPYLRVDVLQIINTNTEQQQQQDRRSSGIGGGKSDANPNDENNNNDNNNLLVIVIVVVVCSMLLCVGIAATVYFRCTVTNKKNHNNNNNNTGKPMVQGGLGAGCEYSAIGSSNTFQNIRIVTGT
jgi:cysteine-rich repeat protein